jgi:S-formylglutathione hydrolase FrmB
MYSLHGYGGSYSNWIIRVPALKKYADDFQILIVCPDGNIGSWYFDSPLDSNYRYETHITAELIPFIDNHYRTIANIKGRAITGLSMGGHGALFLSLKHPDIFGAAGSMSGGVDLSQSKSKFEIMQRIGDTLTYADNWHNMTVINLIEQYRKTPVKIIFDCGNKDIFVEATVRLHQKMLNLEYCTLIRKGLVNTIGTTGKCHSFPTLLL